MVRKQNGQGFRVERSHFRLEQEVSIGHFQKDNDLTVYSIQMRSFSGLAFGFKTSSAIFSFYSSRIISFEISLVISSTM